MLQRIDLIRRQRRFQSAVVAVGVGLVNGTAESGEPGQRQRQVRI